MRVAWVHMHTHIHVLLYVRVFQRSLLDESPQHMHVFAGNRENESFHVADQTQYPA